MEYYQQRMYLHQLLSLPNLSKHITILQLTHLMELANSGYNRSQHKMVKNQYRQLIKQLLKLQGEIIND